MVDNAPIRWTSVRSAQWVCGMNIANSSRVVITRSRRWNPAVLCLNSPGSALNIDSNCSHYNTNSAIFLFSSALCSTVRAWVWLACFPNLCTKDLELTPCHQYSRFSITPYLSSASQNTLFSVSLPQPLTTTPSQRALILLRLRRFINFLLTYLLT